MSRRVFTGLGIVALFLPAALPAAILNVAVQGVTHTQAILAYTAPSDEACTIEVSPSPTYAPPVHDVDPSLFPGSNLDSRPGSLTDGRSRVVVIGRHGMTARGKINPFLASDGHRYSRALQADSLHYYRIRCGNDVATGSFKTGNIPLGSTYPEPLASDQSTPGAYNWPSVVHPSSRSESFVDPNTGALIRKITVSSESDNPENAFGWPDGGMFQICSHQPMEKGGHTYFLCYVPAASYSALYSIESDTGNVYPLTRLSIPYGSFGCSSTGPVTVGKVVFSPKDGARFYVVGTCAPDFLQKVFMCQWTGSLNAGHPIPASAHTPEAALQMTLLTPSGLTCLLAAFDPAFDTAQQANMKSWYLGGIQRNALIFRLAAQQDGMGWVVVFDPGNDRPIGDGGTGGIVAALPSWKAPATRWCTLHSIAGSGDNNPWIGVTSNTPNGSAYMMGAYTVVAAAGGTGNVVTLAPTNGSYEPQSSASPGYLQDAMPGDLFYVGSPSRSSEAIELVSKNTANHTWTVIRGDHYAQSRFIAGSDVPPAVRTVTNIQPGTRLYAGCRAGSLEAHNIDNSAFWWWNFVKDPHGASIVYPAVNGTASSQVVENYATGAHEVTRDSVNIMAGASNAKIRTGWIRWEHPNSTPGYDLAAFSNIVNANPKFASLQPPDGSNIYQQHPSFEQVQAAPRERQWHTDAMPFTNQGNAYNATAARVAGQANTYRITGAHLHPKITTTLASCGAHPLADVSGTSTGNVISDQTPYSSCIAAAPNECRSGASPGEVYVSCPGVTKPACDNQPGTDAADICIGDAWAYGNSAVQVSASTADTNGASGRVISQLFATHHKEWPYDNVQPTADARWLLFSTRNLTGTPEAYMAKLPPFPPADAIRRDTFVPIEITVPAGAGDNAIVEFGYLENGAADKFYCTSRQESCVAQGAIINESTPFFFSETEARSITGMPCASGCKILVPALPGRVLYYRVKSRDRLGRVIRVYSLQAHAVP